MLTLEQIHSINDLVIACETDLALRQRLREQPSELLKDRGVMMTDVRIRVLENTSNTVFLPLLSRRVVDLLPAGYLSSLPVASILRRALTDGDFKIRLLEYPVIALTEAGVPRASAHTMRVIEDTGDVFYLVLAPEKTSQDLGRAEHGGFVDTIREQAAAVAIGGLISLCCIAGFVSFL